MKGKKTFSPSRVRTLKKAQSALNQMKNFYTKIQSPEKRPAQNRGNLTVRENARVAAMKGLPGSLPRKVGEAKKVAIGGLNVENSAETQRAKNELARNTVSFKLHVKKVQVGGTE